MRIGLIIYGSLDTLSGGYLYDRKLVEHLRSQGDTVEIVSFPWKSYPRHLIQNFDPGLKAAIETTGVDVWLQDELNHPSLFWINRALRRASLPPLVAIVHHLRSSEEHPRVTRWLYRQVERAYLKTVDAFVFNSQTTRRSVENMLGSPPKGVVATPAGDRFGNGLSLADIERRAITPGPLRILFVGNLIRRKGLDTLLRGLAQIKTEDWVLRVVGRTDVDLATTAEFHDRVQREGFAGRVHFLGPVPDEQLAREFQSAHVLAVISSYEGFGIVYLEGMSFGLPAIASSAGAAGEIIIHGQNGYLVSPGDAAAAASALRGYCRDRGLLLSHSQSARGQYDRFPGWEQSMGRIREFLSGIQIF